MKLLSLAAAWVAGVFLALQLDPPATAIGLFAAASVLLALLLRSVGRSALPAILLLLALLGALRVGLLAGDAGSSLAAYHGHRPVHVEGLVVGYPEPAGTATQFRLSVERVESDGAWTEASGDLLVTLRPSSELASLRDRPFVRYGDLLLLQGAIEKPRALDDFDYPAYLARQGIGSVMSFPEARLVEQGQGLALYRWLHDVRRSIAGSLVRSVPEPQAALGQALLLGLRDDLPDDLVEDFRVTGTSHVLAISGLHVGILLGISLAGSTWLLGRRRQLYLVAPLVLIWLYAFLAGLPPSAMRAAIMGTVYLAALALGRPRSVLPALGLAAAVMVGMSPRVLWSVSFQLSFAAMAGLAVMAESIDQRIRRMFGVGPDADRSFDSLLAFVSYTTAMTIAATIATLPLVAFYFQRVSLIGLPATLLVLPALTPVLVTQAVTGVVGLASTTVALPLGWLAWVTTAYMTWTVDMLARFPEVYVDTGRIAPLLVWAYYGMLLPVYFWRRFGATATHVLDRVGVASPRPLTRERAVPWWALLPAVAVAAMLWMAAVSLPDGRLHVVFADVGQGDATLVTTPSGKHILVDGGPDPALAGRLLSSALPFWDQDLDLVVLTHPHSDHVAGLTETLRRYDVAHVLERRIDYDSAAQTEWSRALVEEEAAVTQAQAGQEIAFDDGVRIEVLNPSERLFRGTASDIDNASVVLRLSYGDVSFLLTGDIFAEAERALVSRGAALGSTVLKVAHHGSRSSSSEAFVRSVSPMAAVISAGQDNRFDHPHAETLKVLAEHVTPNRVFATKDSGAVEFVTDGRRLSVATER